MNMTDSRLEFEILLDNINKTSADTIDRSADVLQSLGRWLLQAGEDSAGRNAVSLAEDLEGSVQYAPQGDDEEVAQLTQALASKFDADTVHTALRFWALLLDDSKIPVAVQVLNEVEVLMNKESDAIAASQARKIATWLKRTRQ